MLIDLKKNNSQGLFNCSLKYKFVKSTCFQIELKLLIDRKMKIEQPLWC